MNARHTLRPAHRLLLLVLACGAAASLYFASRAAVADSLILQSRWQLTQWLQAGTTSVRAVDWGRVRNDFAKAQQWASGDPQIDEGLGHLYALRAVNSRAMPDLESAMLDQAIAYYREAIARRPMSPHPWANLALALHYRKTDAASLWQAYDRAYRYGQREGAVQRILAEIGFARWAEAGGQRQGELTALVDNAYPHSRNDLIAIARRHGNASFESR